MAGSRSQHNLKRRMKLIERQTGKPWTPRHVQDSREKSWEKWSGSWNEGQGWQEERRPPRRQKAVLEETRKRQTRGTKKKEASVPDVPKKGKRLKQRRTLGAALVEEAKKRELRARRQTTEAAPDALLVPKRRKRFEQRRTLGRALVDEAKKREIRGRKKTKLGTTDVAPTALSHVKKRKLKLFTATEVTGVTNKKLKRVTKSDLSRVTKKKRKHLSESAEGVRRKNIEFDSPPAPRGGREKGGWLSKKARMRAALGIEKRIKQVGTIICPGSLTERFMRNPLNGNERRLLSTGGLSWRWLREPDDAAALPGAAPPQPDKVAHRGRLEARVAALPVAAARKLRHVDECLGVHGLWPPCAARAALAVRLQKKGALRKRCVRHLAEVVEPLLAEVRAVAPGSDSGKVADSSAPFFAEARRLCVQCAEAWQSLAGGGVTQQGCPERTWGTWLQMLCQAAIADELPQRTTMSDAWLRSLQCVLYARLCPYLDAEAEQRMFRTVVQAAESGTLGKQGADCTSLPTLVLLPLGVFTLWQVLLLLAAARWLGTEATVVRRTAVGPLEVVFRSAGPSAGAAAAAA